MYQQAVQHLLLTTIFQDAQSFLKSPQLQTIKPAEAGGAAKGKGSTRKG